MIKIYLLLIGIVLFYSFSNGQDIHSQQYLSTTSNFIEKNNLRLLSWNIQMPPPPYGWFHKPIKRAKNIIQALKISATYDVILFQEAFPSKIRKMIYKSLKSTYPYQIEPDNQSSFFMTNSGLWVISRNPIVLIDEISFSQLREWDKLASKGAKLYSTIKNGLEFYLINTHMQADYKTKYNLVRTKQYIEINNNLILPYLKQGLPMILCGDLNISQPSHLTSLLKKLKLQNGFLSGKLQFSTVGEYKELLDYILVRTETFKFQSEERKIQDMTGDLFLKPDQLSDHYAIEGLFRW